MILLHEKLRKLGHPFAKPAINPIRRAAVKELQIKVVSAHLNGLLSNSMTERRPLIQPCVPTSIGGCDNQNDDLIVFEGDVLIDPNGPRFIVTESLGEGTFGCVYRGYDASTDTGNRTYVAIKVAKSSPALRRQAVEEARIMRLIQSQATTELLNIPRLLHVFEYRGHQCLVMGLLLDNLFKVLENRDYAGLPLGVVQSVARDVFSVLALLRRVEIVHSDIKPENITAVPGRGNLPTVALIDFGSSRHISLPVSTFDLQSIYYRAPEVALHIDRGYPIDVWSTMCVLVELFMGTPLFPGLTEYSLLNLMVEFLGPIPMALVTESSRRSELFNPDGSLKPEAQLCRERGMRVSKRWASYKALHVSQIIMNYGRWFGDTLEKRQVERERRVLFVDFIVKGLTYIADDRLTAEDALAHPFLTTDFGS